MATTLTPAPPEAPRGPSAAPAAHGHRLRLAVAGGLAAAAALTAGEVAALLPSVPSPVISIARIVIGVAPFSVREAAIGTLGTSDKPALLLGVAVVSLVLGAALGLTARTRRPVAMAGIAAFGCAGLVAATQDPASTLFGGLVAAAVGIIAGCGVLRLLVDAAQPAPAATAPGKRRRAEAMVAAQGQRRRFLAQSGATAGAVVLGAVVVRARGIDGASSGPVAAPPTQLPTVAAPVPAVDPAAAPVVAGLSPLVTPVEDFYRIDTALVIPRVDTATWKLSIEGMVDRPFTLTYADLLALPQMEADVTLSCVSNEVGGDLVGNQRWQGVLLSDLLARAGVQAGATQIVGQSVDGFTAGFPTATLDDGRAAMVAIGMAGRPLPAMHGYPARLVIPGLYGYVSATKWLKKIRLTRLEDVDGYWVPRGWSKLAPIKTQSRIDVPGRRIAAGTTPIAGVAWAPTRGIGMVEVQVDSGPWQAAKLAPAIGPDTWVQWVLPWDATPGRHILRVRATDGTGQTQPERRSRPDPDGATGWHTIAVTVT